MGKEQDLLVAVKNGDLLLAHKLLSKVKCNKTSEYRASRGRESWLLNDVAFLLAVRAWECNCLQCNVELLKQSYCNRLLLLSFPSAYSVE